MLYTMLYMLYILYITILYSNMKSQYKNKYTDIDKGKGTIILSL